MSQPADIQVLFSDDALLVVNKPAGLSTLPDGYNPTLPHIKSVLERQFGPLWIVHRLDKDTSGVLLISPLSRSTPFCEYSIRAAPGFQGIPCPGVGEP